MREFNTEGLTREALDQVYQIVLTQKIALEMKLERLKKELSVGACAIMDGAVELEQAGQGLLNLVAYAEAKIDLSDELDETNVGAIDLVNKHLEKIKEFEISKLNERKKVKKSFIVYTDTYFALSPINLYVSNKKYLSEKQFNAENDKSFKVLGKILDKKEFKVENYI